MVAFPFLCLFLSVVSVSYSMTDKKKIDAWCYKGHEFVVMVKALGDVHSLTTHDKRKIKRWISAKGISAEDKLFIKTSIFAFIHAQIKYKPEVIDVTDVTHGKYLFRMFEILKNGTVYKTTRDQCEHVATWLSTKGMKKHCHEKERIKIVNHGQCISLRAKNNKAYKAIIPQDKDRQGLLEHNKLIALLSADEGKDVTSEASLKPTLQFQFAWNQKK